MTVNTPYRDGSRFLGVFTVAQRAGVAPAATDLASVPATAPQGVTSPAGSGSRGTPLSAAGNHLAAYEPQVSPAAQASHPPRVHNLPADSVTSNVDKVEEWLSFSLSGSHRSPASTPRSDHDPLPPGAPDGVESCDLPPPPAAEDLAFSREGLLDGNPDPNSQDPALDPSHDQDAAADPTALQKSSSGKSCSREREVSAVPDEVLSAIRLFTQTAPAATCGFGRTSPGPNFNRCGSATSHASRVSNRAPLGEPATVYGAGAPRGSTALPPPPDSPTAAAANANSGRSSPRSGPPATYPASPAPSANGGASTPSRIVLDGVLSMLQNRSSEPNGSSPPTPIPDALSQALASLHARSASLEYPNRGAPQRSLSHGSTPHGTALHNSSGVGGLRRPHSIHRMSVHSDMHRGDMHRGGDMHATTYPLEARPLTRNRTPTSSTHTGSTTQSPQFQGALSPPLMVPTGLPGGEAMKKRVTKMFFASHHDESSLHPDSLHPDPVLDTTADTQVCFPLAFSGNLAC